MKSKLGAVAINLIHPILITITCLALPRDCKDIHFIMDKLPISLGLPGYHWILLILGFSSGDLQDMTSK